MANRLMNALYEDYKTLKATFCSNRTAKLGVNLKDILLGNKTETFSKFRREFIDKTQARKDYYYSSTPPKTFDAHGKDWLEMYWAKIVKDRPPRDRAAEKMRRKKMRETSVPGGSVANGDISD
jgi:protein involved in temperature-dependent protein secretion